MSAVSDARAPRERPILFSGPMVRAILAGEKTQTRRTVKGLDDDYRHATWVERGGVWAPCEDLIGRGVMDQVGPVVRCPYGVPGNRLWVRETWCIADPDYGHHPHDGRPTRADDRWCWYAATEPQTERHDGGAPWKPSIHMPRWASRITLEITGVRVERVQDISEGDIAAEGVTQQAVADLLGDAERAANCAYTLGPMGLWALGWTAINGVDSWAANPLVWVVEFRPVVRP